MKVRYALTAAIAAGTVLTGATIASATTAAGEAHPKPAPSPTSTTTTTTSPQVVYGTYSGLYDGDLAANLVDQWLPQTQALQAWTGKNEGVTNLYATGIGLTTSTLLIPDLTTVWNQAHTVPSISWTVTNSYAQNLALAKGQDDAALKNFAAALKTFLAGPDGKYGTADDRRLYLRPDWEANGTWYGYSPDYGDPSDAQFQANAAAYVAMWRHLVTVLRGQGLDGNHVQFIFSVADTDSWRTNIATGQGGEPITKDIWPGEQYVDWVGVDGYNMGTTTPQGWRTPAQVFNPMLGTLLALAPHTPLAVTEVGTLGTGAPAGQSVSTWISDYFTWLQKVSASYPLRMSVWFNCSGNGGDYRVFGRTEGDQTFTFDGLTYHGYSTYQTGVNGTYLVGSNLSDPRYLTDTQFQGS